MSAEKVRKFGERARITDIGEYGIGKFVHYDGHYDLPLGDNYNEKIFTLDKATDLLESEGYRVASAEEVAQARIEEGRIIDSGICLGASTKEALITLPWKGLLMMTKNSPLLSNIKSIHNLKTNFYEDGWYAQFIEDDCLNNVVEINPRNLVYDEKGKVSIPIERFGGEEITKFLFGKTAKNYGRFLEKIGFKSVPIPDPDGMLEIIKYNNLPSRVSQFHFNHQGYAGMGFNGLLYHDPNMFFIKPSN